MYFYKSGHIRGADRGGPAAPVTDRRGAATGEPGVPATGPVDGITIASPGPGRPNFAGTDTRYDATSDATGDVTYGTECEILVRDTCVEFAVVYTIRPITVRTHKVQHRQVSSALVTDPRDELNERVVCRVPLE